MNLISKDMYKILNLYSGIGGNRKDWDIPLIEKFGKGNYQITAVEYNAEIAALYQSYYENDIVIVGDAHEYLLQHFQEFDFIWGSPPCPTHSRARYWGSKGGTTDIKYPEMSLYQEILLLKHYYSGKYVIENVIPFYSPLIDYDYMIDRHLFWSNIKITQKKFNKEVGINNQDCNERFGFSLKGVKINHRKDQILRNIVNPEIGLHFLNRAIEIKEANNISELKFNL